MKTPVYVFAKWQVKKGNTNTVLALLKNAAEASRKEEGNLFYKVHQSNTDPDTLILYEGYADETAAAAHRSSAHFQEVVIGQIVPLLENRDVIATAALNF